MNKTVCIIILTSSLFACHSGNGLPASAEDTTNIKTKPVWDTSYGGADKSYDTGFLRMRDAIAPKFKTLQFKDSVTGKTMTYNLFVPKDYDKTKSYPLLQFIADASIVGKGAEAPLKQGYGGIIWATDESQAAHPCFVLVSAFAGPDWAVNDQWQTSDEVGMELRLLKSVVSEYSIDTSRLYTTGQSMGGMISFYLNATQPNLFAASLFVGSQWDIRVLAPLAKETFFYIVSAGDEKASGGMQQLGELLKNKGARYDSTEFSAQLPQAEQEKKIAELISKGDNINFVKFTRGTVVPAGASERGAPEHMYSFDYAYKLKGVRDWLFTKRRTK